MPPPRQGLELIRVLLEPFADSYNAGFMRAKMGNQFDFYGVRCYRRYKLLSKYYENQGVMDNVQLKELCSLCFEEGEKREVQYFANDIACRAIHRLEDTFLDTVDELIGKLSWTDTVVDALAPRIAGPLFLKYPHRRDEYIQKWVVSENIWYQQAAITFQLYYRHHTDEETLFNYIRLHADTDNYFVKKASGLALKHYARINPQAVKDFMKEEEELAVISKQEASRIL